MYLLTKERDRDDWGEDDWPRYLAYLESVRDRFPPSAYALATADWHYAFADHRSAHDGRLIELSITEEESTNRSREGPSIRIRVLNAWGDGILEFRYVNVVHYQLTGGGGARGHGDWRYDEFRLSADGYVLHEIEWWSAHETARWIIKASDVEFDFHPVEPTPW